MAIYFQAVHLGNPQDFLPAPYEQNYSVVDSIFKTHNAHK